MKPRWLSHVVYIPPNVGNLSTTVGSEPLVFICIKLTQLGARKDETVYCKSGTRQSALPLSRLYVLQVFAWSLGIFWLCSFS